MIPKRDKLLLRLHLFCKAEPLKRPRIGNHRHIYQPKDNQVSLLNELEAYRPLLTASSINEAVIIDMVFGFSRGKPTVMTYKGDYPTGKNFGDEDNLRKAVNDAMVAKKLLVDDALVIGGETYKIFDNDNNVKIKIWSVKSE